MALGSFAAEIEAEQSRTRNAGNPVGPVGEAGPIREHQPYDLAETERHDRKVVAAQAQNRQAEDQRGGDGNRGTDRRRRPETETDRGRQQSVAIGAERVKAGITEIEEAGITHGDVKPQANMT